MYPPRREAPAFSFLRFFIIGGGAISFAAGMINVCTLLSAYGLSSTHMTGLLTQLAVESVSATPVRSLGVLFCLVLAFVLGASISGAVLESSRLRFSHRYGYLLFVESILLGIATYFLWQESYAGIVLAALAAGLQNALATQYSSAILRTTHVTGILTDLGISIGRRIRGSRSSLWRVYLHLTLLFGYGFGSVCAAMLYQRLGAWTMAVPTTIILLCALIYWRRRGVLDRASTKIVDPSAIRTTKDTMNDGNAP